MMASILNINHWRNFIICTLTVITFNCLHAIGAHTPTPYSVPVEDAPELAKTGAHSVGVRSMKYTNKDQPDVLKLVKTFGIMGKSDRQLNLEIWYPAVHATNAARAQYTANLPRGAASEATNNSKGSRTTFTHTGLAVRDAAAVTGQKFPLVLVSHGFGGWGTFMTYLTENIASKGYVVVAIDHADPAFDDGKSFAISFGSTIVLRSRDQQFAITQLSLLANQRNDPIGNIIDATKIGVIGYSMGGFGALATAGAGYDAASPTFKQIPAKLMAPIVAGNSLYTDGMARRSGNIKALVLMAPWGGQTASRAWTTASLGAVKAPTFIITGDQDDISDYANGIKYLFQNMTGATRNMLVYQNARHNIGGNPAPGESHHDFSIREYFDEPVWRKERVMAINQHFVTAFLDLHLKGKQSSAAYLDLPTVNAADGKWNVPFGQQTGNSFANGTDATAAYWRGFQRRWALGLEMHRRKLGEK